MSTLVKPAYITVRPASILAIGDPPLWRIIITNLAGTVLTTLDKRASGRSFLFTLDEPASASGLVPSDDPEINIPSPTGTSPPFLSNNSRLLYGLRREIRATPLTDPWKARFGGVIMGLEDVGADTPTSRYTAYDPWQLLMARPIRTNSGTLAPASGIEYTNARASVMAVDLLANTVAADGTVLIDASDSSLIEATDVIPGKTVFDRGISVGEAWQQLCATGTIDIVLRPIYDPHTRPGKLAELVIAKRAGSVRYNAVLGWDRASRSLTELSRLIDGTRLANHVQFYAGQGGRPVTPQIDAASVAEYGSYWAQQFIVSGRRQALIVELLALADLLTRRNGPRNLTLSPAPERSYLSLRDYGLGDYVPVWASRNLRAPLGVDYDTFDPATPGASGYQRILSIPIDVDDDGVERVRGLVTAETGIGSETGT